MNAIIIDDEKLARDLIKSFLSDLPSVSLCGECEDGYQGLKLIQEQKPDLIFLDIQMPKLTGFEMLELIDNPPVVIFTTAYDEFAIKAFEINAVDYLLKPFSRERLLQAIQKAEVNLKQKKEDGSKIKTLLNNVGIYQKEKLERIVIKSGSKMKVIPIEELLYIEAQDDYVMCYTKEGKYLKHQTMKYFEEALPSSKFLRVHRSYIVNIQEIGQIEPYEKDSYQLMLKSGAKLPISRSGYSHLKKNLNF